MSLAMQAAKMGQPLNPRNMNMGDPGLWDWVKDRALNLVDWSVPGPVVGGVRRLTSSRPASPARTVTPPGGGPAYPVAVRKPGARAAVERFLPGGETGLGAGCPKGHHPNKSSYFLKDGTFVEEGTKCVKHRRRYNPANAQATSRSIGRVNSAKRMQGALSQISTGKYTASGKRKPHHHS